MTTSICRKFPLPWKAWTEALRNVIEGVTEEKPLSSKLALALEWKPISILNTRKPDIVAIDTETYQKNANLICLCNSENSDTMYGYIDKQPTIYEYYEYLKNLKITQNTVFICYNLKYDASILLKSLREDIDSFMAGELDEDGYQKKYIHKSSYDGSPFNIVYIPKKALKLRHRNTTVTIFDAAQFFFTSGVGGRSSLDSVAEKFLGKQKQYEGKYQNKKFPDDILTDKDETFSLVKYCQLDCVLTKQIMNLWLDAFYVTFNFYPSVLYSVGSITLEYFRTKFENFPVFKSIPYPVQQMAWYSYFGGRFEITKKGSLKNVYHYDINSAYPYAMSLLPDFLHGKWFKVNTVKDALDFNQDAGYYRIKVNVKENNFAPFPFRAWNGSIIFPKYEYSTYVTHHELLSAVKGNYDFTIDRIEGYKFISSDKSETDFNKLIKGMYKSRLEQKNEGQKYIYKILMNSGYGKFAQSKPIPKGIFSPVIASYITGKCRAMILDAASERKDNIIMAATDGLFSSSPLSTCEKTSGKKVLGEWEGELHPNFALCMAGVYSNNTEKDLAMKTKTRGFSLKAFDDEGNEMKFDLTDYKLTFNEKEGKYYYLIKNKRPVAISEAVIQKQFGYEDIGKMRFVEKEINLNGDVKRAWFKNITSIYDYSDSECPSIL